MNPEEEDTLQMMIGNFLEPKLWSCNTAGGHWLEWSSELGMKKILFNEV